MVATEIDVSKVAVLVQQGGHLLDHIVVNVEIAGKCLGLLLWNHIDL